MYVLQKPPTDTSKFTTYYISARLNFKESPFYTIVDNLTPALELKGTVNSNFLVAFTHLLVQQLTRAMQSEKPLAIQ